MKQQLTETKTMPVSFQFVSVKTGEVVALNQVDKEMCEDQNIPCDEKSYCGLFIFCQILGTSPHVQDDKGEIDPDKLDAYLRSPHLEVRSEQIPQVKKYLIGEYKMKSWYGR